MTSNGPRDAVPGDSVQPSNDTVDESVLSEPLDLDDGPDVVIAQENVGPGSELGGGERPDPSTGPSKAAPGPEGTPERETAARKPDVYDQVSPEQAASGTTPKD